MSTAGSLKDLRITTDSADDRMSGFAEMDAELSYEETSPSSLHGSRSRIASRCAPQAPVSPSRVSVKDQLYGIECKVNSHEETIQKLMAIHDADKALLLARIEQIAERFGEEIHFLRKDYEEKLHAAKDEIERLNKCLHVQRGHITNLQEQCQSIHRHVAQVDDDVNKLANEILGDQ